MKLTVRFVTQADAESVVEHMPATVTVLSLKPVEDDQGRGWLLVFDLPGEASLDEHSPGADAFASVYRFIQDVGGRVVPEPQY